CAGHHLRRPARNPGGTELPHPACERGAGAGGRGRRRHRRHAAAARTAAAAGGAFLGGGPGRGAGPSRAFRRPARGHRADRRQRPLLRWVLRLCVLAVLWLAGVATWIHWVGERDEARPADAIIVLGAAAYDAVPSPVFRARIEHGLDLYRAGHARVLLFTGGYGGGGARFAESQVARRYAIRQGIPEEAILIESSSQTTYQNLFEARTLMLEHGLRDAIVVSDPLH